MLRLDRRLSRALARFAPGAALMLGAASTVGAAEPAGYRWAAPIEVSAAAPFVALPLPPEAYARSAQSGLRDLRVVDAAGERVPFALITPPVETQASERVREATLYPLPARPASGGTWPSPVQVTVDGDRINVRRSAAAAPPPHASPGWLFDLGETPTGEPAPTRLRLRWSGPAEFSAGYAIETSADLRAWRTAGSGQVLALQSPGGALTQPVVELPPATGRFVRLVWSQAGAAPLLDGAGAVTPEPDRTAFDPATALTIAPTLEAASAAKAGAPGLVVDLGGVLPLVDLNLRFATGTRVAPVRLQARSRAEEPWHDAGSGVFYRIERDGTVVESPALTLSAPARYLRIVVDERAGALDASKTTAVVRVRLASVVFASSGAPPFRLLAGSADAAAGALPASTLVPGFDEERKRFGRAALGAWSEVPEAARSAADAERMARLRPWLLWTVLGVGVAGLGALVWRLARSGAASPPAA
jgi:hypothetical protein